jgi:hypothetical protein
LNDLIKDNCQNANFTNEPMIDEEGSKEGTPAVCPSVRLALYLFYEATSALLFGVLGFCQELCVNC